MWEQIFNMAISNGLFAVLFLALLVYQLKDSRNREKKYQDTITKLGNSLEIVRSVKEDVEEIKNKISSSRIVLRKVKTESSKGDTNAKEN